MLYNQNFVMCIVCLVAVGYHMAECFVRAVTVWVDTALGGGFGLVDEGKCPAGGAKDYHSVVGLGRCRLSGWRRPSWGCRLVGCKDYIVAHMRHAFRSGNKILAK
jgi:hypothetical protein